MTFENVHESKSISKQNMLLLILHAGDESCKRNHRERVYLGNKGAVLWGR